MVGRVQCRDAGARGQGDGSSNSTKRRCGATGEIAAAQWRPRTRNRHGHRTYAHSTVGRGSKAEPKAEAGAQSRCRCGQGQAQSRCRCGQGRAQSRYGCGRGEPSPGADVARGKSSDEPRAAWHRTGCRGRAGSSPSRHGASARQSRPARCIREAQHDSMKQRAGNMGRRIGAQLRRCLSAAQMRCPHLCCVPHLRR